VRGLHKAEDLLSLAARLTGIIRVSRALNRRRLVVLNYHGVVPDELARDPLLNSNVVGVSEFAHQMAQVSRLFCPIRASELRNWQDPRAKPAALITFDDGYRNNLLYAAPVLKKFGIPAVVAICPGYVGQKRMLWPDEIHWRVLWWPEQIIPIPSLEAERRIPHDFSERVALANYLRQYCKRLPWEQVGRYLAALRKYPVRDPVEEVHGFLSWDEVRALDLSPKLRQTVKTHFSSNGELSHGSNTTEVHEGV
jgi:hypothetical protein